MGPLTAFASMSCVLRFEVEAHTNYGEDVVLTGSREEVGGWNVARALPLKTTAERYPLWWSEAIEFPGSGNLTYKYAKRCAGALHWEVDGSRLNRRVEFRPGLFVVHDFVFGRLQKWPFGFGASQSEMRDPAGVAFPFLTYNPKPVEPISAPRGSLGICVLGSSVACGCFAWQLKGWSTQLAVTLEQRYRHKTVNVSMAGANVDVTLQRFPEVVTPRKPDVVVVSLSLGNEGTFHCEPDRRKQLQRQFLKGIQKLVECTRAIGAVPVLGGVYPNGDAVPETYELIKGARKEMAKLGVPVIDWLDVLDDGHGRWKEGLSTDIAHPNTEGHQLMFDRIDLEIFDPNSRKFVRGKGK